MVDQQRQKQQQQDHHYSKVGPARMSNESPLPALLGLTSHILCLPNHTGLVNPKAGKVKRSREVDRSAAVGVAPSH